MQLLRAPAAASLGASRSTAFRSSSAFRPRAALRRRACAATTRAANQDDSFRAGSASSLSAGEAMKARFPAPPRCLLPSARAGWPRRAGPPAPAQSQRLAPVAALRRSPDPRVPSY